MKPEVLIEMARDWANIKRRQACDILGSPEASELLADAKKFDLVVDALKVLTAHAAPVAPMSESQRADMICAVAAICTGTSSRTVAATAIEWVERYYGITTPAALCEKGQA